MVGSEKALHAEIRAALSLDAEAALLDAMIAWAALMIERGMTQEGADVLAWVLRQTALPSDAREQAEEIWEELAAYICPRVLLDAQDFAAAAEQADLIEYIFAGEDESP